MFADQCGASSLAMHQILLQHTQYASRMEIERERRACSYKPWQLSARARPLLVRHVRGSARGDAVMHHHTHCASQPALRPTQRSRCPTKCCASKVDDAATGHGTQGQSNNGNGRRVVGLVSKLI